MEIERIKKTVADYLDCDKGVGFLISEYGYSLEDRIDQIYIELSPETPEDKTLISKEINKFKKKYSKEYRYSVEAPDAS